MQTKNKPHTHKIEIQPSNHFRNNDKVIAIGNTFWNTSRDSELAGIVANVKNNTLITGEGHHFVNFSCCSYLDLDSYPVIIEGAIKALKHYGVLDHCIPRTRVQLPALLELEDCLGDLFNAKAVSAISASVATMGLLPLIASGHLGNGQRPLMIFDKNCHVSMNHSKPICADETEIVTCKHHDIDFIEEQCKQYQRVCYVCDGSDSLGGYAPIEALKPLQERYGLLVYYDDSHSISAYGKQGVGYVRSHYKDLDENTIIVATLNKAFGASGAVILSNGYSQEVLNTIEQFGGALSYSQPLNIPGIGAAMASCEVHKTQVLVNRQLRLQKNIALFDSLVNTRQAGTSFPIRVVPFSDDTVIKAGQRVYNAGYYVSPVFFPIVARGTAGLRVMLRVGQSENDIRGLCKVLTDIESEGNINE